MHKDYIPAFVLAAGLSLLTALLFLMPDGPFVAVARVLMVGCTFGFAALGFSAYRQKQHHLQA
jgi:uncharacterized MnhB-related membrane protein